MINFELLNFCPTWRQIRPHLLEPFHRIGGSAHVHNAADLSRLHFGQPAPNVERFQSDLFPLSERRITDAFKDAQRLCAQRVDRKPEA